MTKQRRDRFMSILQIGMRASDTDGRLRLVKNFKGQRHMELNEV